MRIRQSVVELIGGTPMVRINRIAEAEGVQCEIVGKCEFLNPGGSIKDRIGKRMVQEAERAGRVKPGDCLVEPTSGNTGIGLAMVAAVKGYKSVMVMPEKMSREKVNCLTVLGAEIVRTPAEAAFDAPDSHIRVAERIQGERDRATVLDQYTNPDNPLAHYHETAEEIWADCDGRLDAVVMGAGTGGTIAGVGRRLKELNPDIKVVGVDPIGSLLAGPAEVRSYAVEGIGYDFIPAVLDPEVIDEWIKCSDAESFAMARRLASEEGLLVGGSSGSAMWAAVHVVAKRYSKGHRVVVVLPDSIRNYINKLADDAWMTVHGYMTKEVQVRVDLSECLVRIEPVGVGTTCADALPRLAQEWTPVVAGDGVSIECVVHRAAVFSRILDAKGEEWVERVGCKEFACIEMSGINEMNHLDNLNNLNHPNSPNSDKITNYLSTCYPVFVRDNKSLTLYRVDPSKAKF